MLRRTMTMSLFLAVGLLSTGCLHTQLKHNTILQSDTVTHIYEQQVLNNLAMFTVNPYAVPHFATATAGSADVTDKGIFKLGPLNHGINLFNIEGNRTAKGAWTLLPITNPHKLQLMRCAYQRAVGIVNTECPDCCELEKAFEGAGSDCEKCKIQCGWFETSDSKWDVPRHCTLHGEYCGCYVWVCPEYQDEFAKLVLRILDYAIHDGHAGPTKEVEFTIDDVKHTATVARDLNKTQIMDLMNPPPDRSTYELKTLKELGPDWKTRRNKMMIGRPRLSPRGLDFRTFNLRQRVEGGGEE